MKKFLHLHYALIALALGIAVMTIYAKTGKIQQITPNPNHSDQGSMTVESSISSTSSIRRGTLSTSSQVSKAPSQIREVLKPNLRHEIVLQFVARFEKWNEQDISDALVELKSLNDNDVTRITDVYAQAFDEKWTPAEHHWTFLEACYEEYAEVCDNTPYLGNGCMLSTTAQAMLNLAKYRLGQKSPKSQEWFAKMYKSMPKFFILFHSDQKMMAELNLTPVFATFQLTPTTSTLASPSDVPEVKVPYLVK